MAALPYMRFYPADYLADAAHLTTLEHGAYMLLIMNYWQRGGPLPNDDTRLARIARVGPRQWAAMRGNLSEFFTIDCNNWSHCRVEQELAHVSAKSLKSKEAAQASVQRRFGGRSTGVEPTDTDTDTDTDTTLETSSSVSRARNRRKPASPLPENWKPLQPGPTGAAAMIEKHWPRDRREHEIEAFKAHHGSRGNTMVNWQQAWQNWVLNSQKFDRSTSNGSGRNEQRDRTLAAAEDAFGPASEWSDEHPF